MFGESASIRVTGKSFDPTAASINGGRWAPRPNDEPGFPVLYTSLTRDGALAEIASYLALQTPMPSKPLMIHELTVTASKTITLMMADLEELGVECSRYGARNYEQTQKIGVAINYMAFDGLISLSARWECQYLTLFMDHHALDEKLEVTSSEEIAWRRCAKEAKVIDGLLDGRRAPMLC